MLPNGAKNRLIVFLFSIFNPFQLSIVFHIETSHLFCSAKEIIGFNMKRNIGPKWANYMNETYYINFVLLKSYPTQLLCSSIKQ